MNVVKLFKMTQMLINISDVCPLISSVHFILSELFTFYKIDCIEIVLFVYVQTLTKRTGVLVGDFEEKRTTKARSRGQDCGNVQSPSIC